MAEWHPLFPPSEEDDDTDTEPPDIQLIHVMRKENGKYVTAPRVFLASELLSPMALHAEFGGGEYQLIGKDGRHILRRKVLIQLPGPPKPMFDEGPQPIPKPAPPPNPMAALMGGDANGGVMGLIMMMMQQMMAAQQAASQNQSQMMMAFIQSMATGNSAQIAAAQENMNRQAERDARDKQSQMEMLVKLTEARGAGNSTNGEESFFKGVEFMRHFATQQVEVMKATAKGGKEDFDWESLLESGLQALQMFNLVKEGGLPSGSPPTEVVS